VSVPHFLDRFFFKKKQGLCVLFMPSFILCFYVLACLSTLTFFLKKKTGLMCALHAIFHPVLLRPGVSVDVDCQHLHRRHRLGHARVLCLGGGAGSGVSLSFLYFVLHFFFRLRRGQWGVFCFFISFCIFSFLLFVPWLRRGQRCFCFFLFSLVFQMSLFSVAYCAGVCEGCGKFFKLCHSNFFFLQVGGMQGSVKGVESFFNFFFV